MTGSVGLYATHVAAPAAAASLASLCATPALPSWAAAGRCESVQIQNDPSNVPGQDVYIGTSQGVGYRLTVGSAETVSVADLSIVFVQAVAGTPRVNVLIRG